MYDQRRYNSIARILHASMALIIIGLLLVGFFHDYFPKDVRGPSMLLHKSLGMTIFILTLLRIFWRMGHKPPALPSSMTVAQEKLSALVHWLLYILMLAMPIFGFTMSSGGDRPMLFFGIEVPKLPIEKGDMLAGLAHEGHEIGGYIMAALVVFHIAAAFYHQMVMKDNLIRRMW